MMSKPLQIDSENWSLLLEPENGLQIVACRVKKSDQWHNVMPDCTIPNAPLAAANFHMLPYSNRIRDGLFSFEGVTYQLQYPEKHAIHGALRKLAWRVTEQSTQHLTATFDTQQDGEVNWPWPIEASIHYRLDNSVLHSELSLTNKGRSNMPAGLGWHPYFVRNIGDATPELTLGVSGVYPDIAGDCLPDGAPVALPKALDFTTAKILNPTQRIDACLSGFDGNATIEWPAADIKLRMQADSVCKHLVLFNPDATYFAVEPVSNANDGFNLQSAGIDAGVHIMQPQQTLKSQLRIELL